MPEIDFNECFKALTSLEESESPFPWQEKLFQEFVQKRFRSTCDIPTGLGKTAVIAVWLLALAHHASQGTHFDFPRRLVYVVNRRTVVDQSTHEAENMREALDRETRLKGVKDALQSLGALDWDNPLAISTLRGEMADNNEWRDDPARPAVIVGTVDMIGSRLLFSGYGRGFRSRPLHAAFLGQDTLLVHDEAHLEPAFQELIEAITKEQERCKDFLRMRVMAMTATARSDEDADQPLFTDKDRAHVIVDKRINAKKRICFRAVEEKKIASEIANIAKEYENSEKAILIYARKVKEVIEIEKQLSKDGLQVQKLTGTLRGMERDELAKIDSIFNRFMPTSKSKSSASTVKPQLGTVYLVCTSAGEVGVNISGDHLVCDLTPFDSMAQRFGRVNRFGIEDSRIDVVFANSMPEAQTKEDALNPDNPEPDNSNSEEGKKDLKSKDKKESPFDLACMKTLHLLQKLPKYDDGRFNASPATLSGLPALERLAAFTPHPIILPTSDILFDSWSLTSVRQTLPGRPAVADWLHGIAEWEPPETHVAWREEVSIITGDLLEKYEPLDLLEGYPLKAHELLQDRADRVFENIEKISERCPDLNAWLIQPDSKLKVIPLKQLVQRNRQKKPIENLANCTVLLPPEAGGFAKGFLQGDEEFDKAIRYDVSDQLLDQKGKIQLRCRRWNDDKPLTGMRLIPPIIDTLLDPEDEEEGEERSSKRFWYWYVRSQSAEDDGSRTAGQKQDLNSHLQSAETFACSIVTKLKLMDAEASAVIHAARWHDLGKNRKIWQHAIGNLNYPQQVLAKSDERMRAFELQGYRHEFGSILNVTNHSEFVKLEPDVQDLVLHLIATHHGRARPHFLDKEAFDYSYTQNAAQEISCKVPRRFARLQKKYGRWGLAYIESLVRAADALASKSVISGNIKAICSTNPLKVD